MDLYRFKTEFRSLADIKHPNLCSHSPLRAADSLYLASAALANARAWVTNDRQLHHAATVLGAFEVVPSALAPSVARP